MLNVIQIFFLKTCHTYINDVFRSIFFSTYRCKSPVGFGGENIGMSSVSVVSSGEKEKHS